MEPDPRGPGLRHQRVHDGHPAGRGGGGRRRRQLRRRLVALRRPGRQPRRRVRPPLRHVGRDRRTGILPGQRLHDGHPEDARRGGGPEPDRRRVAELRSGWRRLGPVRPPVRRGQRRRRAGLPGQHLHDERPVVARRAHGRQRELRRGVAEPSGRRRPRDLRPAVQRVRAGRGAGVQGQRRDDRRAGASGSRDGPRRPVPGGLAERRRGRQRRRHLSASTTTPRAPRRRRQLPGECVDHGSAVQACGRRRRKRRLHGGLGERGAGRRATSACSAGGTTRSGAPQAGSSRSTRSPVAIRATPRWRRARAARSSWPGRGSR